MAEHVGNRMMGLLITGAVLIALLMLLPRSKKPYLMLVTPPSISWRAILIMFFVGLWLGFIVLDSATYLLLVLMLVCHYALLQANALKSVLMAATVVVAIMMFAGAGEVYWMQGIVMCVGSVWAALSGPGSPAM
jgi:uncharacterized membrane protein YfcA